MNGTHVVHYFPLPCLVFKKTHFITLQHQSHLVKIDKRLFVNFVSQQKQLWKQNQLLIKDLYLSVFTCFPFSSYLLL